MKTAVTLCVLLACAHLCSSTPFIGCRCVNTIPAVYKWNVADVIEYGPRPYCRKREVIVVLKNKKQRCLDPNGTFAKLLLREKQEHSHVHPAHLEHAV